MDYVIGIGDYAISKNRNDKLKTYALASCVAMTVYDPTLKIGGMIHMALPNPVDHLDAKTRPAYFVTTGIPLMLNQLEMEYGCLEKRLIVKLYGGARSININDYFQIGMRNLSISRQILAKRNIPIVEEQTGGFISRSLTMNTDNGEVKVLAQPIVV